jgi:hypothetical protein
VSLRTLSPERCPLLRFYFFFLPFFEPDGITLATVLAIELAIFATTPFLGARFLAVFLEAVVFFDLVCAFGAGLEFVFFFAAFFAITDTPTPSRFGKF